MLALAYPVKHKGHYEPLEHSGAGAVVASLVESNGIRAIVRMTGVAKNTTVKLLADRGAACSRNRAAIRNVRWREGEEGTARARLPYDFMQDLSSRLATRVQLNTDGHKVYLNAVEGAFGADIDYAMLVKVYQCRQEDALQPAKCVGCEQKIVSGEPNCKHISTNYVERQNLTMRMSMRRFTRLTNAFSKKLENQAAMVALYFMYYNFGPVHQTLRVTPAMQAAIAHHVWSIEEIVGLLG